MKFLADENFNNQILRAILRRVPDAEIIRVQNTELAGAPDTEVLEWAVKNGYIVLSHDVNTMRGYYYDRLNDDLPLPTLFLVHGDKPVAPVIDDLVLILLASEESEWQGEIRYLPL